MTLQTSMRSQTVSSNLYVLAAGVHRVLEGCEGMIEANKGIRETESKTFFSFFRDLPNSGVLG